MALPEVGSKAVFNAPPHMLDPTRSIAVWFTDPPGMVAQLVRRAPFTVTLAQWLAVPACTRLLKRFPGDEPLAFVLDLTQMDGREPEVRALIVEAARGFASRVERAVVVPPGNAGRVYLASLQAAASLARVFGLTVSVGPLTEAVRGLHPAAPDA
jgi:hypothetical protein